MRDLIPRNTEDNDDIHNAPVLGTTQITALRFITQKANCLLRYRILGDLVINLHEIDHGLSAK